MARSLICPTCSAPFTGPAIPAWTRSVKCNYCGGGIVLDDFGQIDAAIKQLDMDGFATFLRQKGVPYDPVSKAINIRGNTFFIDSSGLVMPDRPEALREVVLRWISEYMNHD